MPARPCSRRRALRLAAIVAAMAAGAGAAACTSNEGRAPAPAAGPTPISASQVPYDPAFTFKRRIPRDPAIDPRSAAIVRQLVENNRNGATFLESRWGPAVYVARRADPFYTVRVGGETVRFRVPAGARPGGGADHPLVILDPLHPDFGPKTELRLFKARVDHARRRLTAAGAGLLHYNNDGRRLNPDGRRSESVPFAGVGTGSGLSILAGLIRPDEVRAGRIRHALRLTYSARDFTSGFRAPAVTTDQPNDTTTRNTATAMEMGMRLQLDPSVDCDRRTVPDSADDSAETRYLRIICRAMQEFGMIVADGTGDRGLIIQAEHTRTARWEEIVGEERYGTYSHLIRSEESSDDGLDRDESSGIPWDRLRVLKRSTF